MQISQFFVGNVFGIAYLVIPNCYNWDSDFRENVLHRVFGSYYASIVFTFMFNFIFVGGLILLFNDFARRTYGQKKHESTKHEKHESDKHDKSSGKSSKKVVAEPVAETVESKPKSKATKAVAKPKKEIPAKKGKTSPVQVAASVEIDVPVKDSKTARAKSRARSTVRSKSKARAASPSKAAPVQRRTRRS